MRRASLITWVLASVLLLSNGCSFTFARGPKPGRARCTHSPALPGLDLLFTTAAVVLYLSARNDAQGEGFAPPKEAITVPAIVLMGVYGFSAVHGFTTVSRCDAAAAAAR
jgi:hypothetical protein